MWSIARGGIEGEDPRMWVTPALRLGTGKVSTPRRKSIRLAQSDPAGRSASQPMSRHLSRFAVPAGASAVFRCRLRAEHTLR